MFRFPVMVGYTAAEGRVLVRENRQVRRVHSHPINSLEISNVFHFSVNEFKDDAEGGSQEVSMSEGRAEDQA